LQTFINDIDNFLFFVTEIYVLQKKIIK